MIGKWVKFDYGTGEFVGVVKRDILTEKGLQLIVHGPDSQIGGDIERVFYPMKKDCVLMSKKEIIKLKLKGAI